MKIIPLGCKSPFLKHVVCFKSQVHMILKSETDELSVAFKFMIDGYDYIVFASSETMRCFGCVRDWQVRRACPEKADDVAAEDDGVIVEEQVWDNVINGEKSTEHVPEQVNYTEIKETDGVK